MPVAVTENLAILPALTEISAGCTVMVGGRLTERVAGLLCTVPATLLTTHRNKAPLSAGVAGGVV